jgi:hypothetical protein
VKDKAIEEILQLARRHDVTLEDLRDALPPAAPEPTRASGGLRGLLPRLFAYLGGTFIFAGVCVFIGINWEEMNTAARIIVTLGSGLAVFTMGLAAASRTRFEKAATPLFLIAAFLQPTGIIVALDELSRGSNWHYAGLLTTGVMAVQQGAAFLARKRTTLLFTTLVFSFTFLTILFDLLHIEPEISAVTLGFSLTLISIVVDRTPHALITPFCYLIGSVSVLYGVFDLLERTPFEILFLLAACGIVYLSVYVRSRTLLVSGTVSILSYIGYFTSQHFLESWGWPLALIVLGLVLIGLSASAVRINQKYIRT